MTTVAAPSLVYLVHKRFPCGGHWLERGQLVSSLYRLGLDAKFRQEFRLQRRELKKVGDIEEVPAELRSEYQCLCGTAWWDFTSLQAHLAAETDGEHGYDRNGWLSEWRSASQTTATAEPSLAERIERLSGRKKTILRLWNEGKTSTQIGDLLGLASETVDKRVGEMRREFGPEVVIYHGRGGSRSTQKNRVIEGT